MKSPVLCGRPPRATNPRSGGHHPGYWQAAVLFNQVFADKFFQSRSFVLVFSFLIDPVFGYVDAHGAGMIVAQKALPYGCRPDQQSSSSLVAGGILEKVPSVDFERDMYGSRCVLLDSDTVSGNVETFVVLCAGRNPCKKFSSLSSAGRFSSRACGGSSHFPSALCFGATTQTVKFGRNAPTGEGCMRGVNVVIMRATDVASDEKRALVCGPGDLGEGHQELIAECVHPLRRAESFLQEATVEESVSEVSIFMRRQCPVRSGASENDIFISSVVADHTLSDGIIHAIDFVIGGRRALVCGYGVVGEGFAPTSAFNRRQWS